MNTRELAARLTSALELDLPPVALQFTDTPPAGVPGPAYAVPSACTFWRMAEQGTFFASAEQHHNCPVGSMVMGFELPEEVKAKLGGLVDGMCEQRYLAPDEPPAIPTIKHAYAGIQYSPLAESTGEPDLVLIWVTPRQAMICNEAMGTASWTAGPPTTTGRPGCAALPLAVSEGQPSLSLGCAGMRTFTSIGNDRMLFAVPSVTLERFVAAIEDTTAVNTQMGSYYAGQKAQFKPGTA